MYIFEAHYTRMRVNEEITRTIEFNGDNFFDNERACYVYAIGKAYDLKEKDECLDSLELISC